MTQKRQARTPSCGLPGCLHFRYFCLILLSSSSPSILLLVQGRIANHSQKNDSYKDSYNHRHEVGPTYVIIVNAVASELAWRGRVDKKPLELPRPVAAFPLERTAHIIYDGAQVHPPGRLVFSRASRSCFPPWVKAWISVFCNIALLVFLPKFQHFKTEGLPSSLKNRSKVQQQKMSGTTACCCCCCRWEL